MTIPHRSKARVVYPTHTYTHTHTHTHHEYRRIERKKNLWITQHFNDIDERIL
jgi:hypothetical protein